MVIRRVCEGEERGVREARCCKMGHQLRSFVWMGPKGKDGEGRFLSNQNAVAILEHLVFNVP